MLTRPDLVILGAVLILGAVSQQANYDALIDNRTDIINPGNFLNFVLK